MLAHANLLSLAVAMVLAFLAIIELGYRIGRGRTAGDPSLATHIAALQAAVLGLLALLLGFTFAMSVARFDSRKALIVEEANAIETTYLRAQILRPPHRENAMRLLRDYVETRLEFYEAGPDRTRLDAAVATTSRLQRELWAVATGAAADDPRPALVSLFVQSLNEVIDLHEKRLRSLEKHVPGAVLLLVFAVAAVALGFIGLGSGLHERRRFVSTAVFSFLIALVISLVLDLDRPTRGLVQISQESMIRLKTTLRTPAAP